MRRVVCSAFGPLSDLTVEDAPDLEAGPGQIVVDVEAAGVNFVDALFCKGEYQIKPQTPFTPGGEVAGTVATVGDGVEGFAEGDRVMASCWLGGYASQVAVGTAQAFTLPDAISFGQGATLVQSYATALFSLKQRTHVADAEWVLVLGAGGGLGRACVDVARSLGGRPIGVASSEAKRQVAKDAGAEETIGADEDVKVRAREISGGGVDVVCDPVGGELAEPALRSLRVGGRYVVLGFAAGDIPKLPANQVLLNNRTVVGVDWGAWTMQEPDANRALIAELLDLVAAGKLHPQEPTPFPLDDAAKVLEDISSRRITGKATLRP